MTAYTKAMTTAQWAALHAAALWALNGDGFLDDWMRQHGCGRNWHSILRRAIETLNEVGGSK